MNWFRKLFKKKEQPVTEEQQKTAEQIRLEALEAEKIAATNAGEPWVAVISTSVNPDNVRYGFFELDWNNEFLESLLDAGYKGETPEELVDMWYKTIVMQMFEEEGMTANQEMGYINVVPISKGKSEVS